MPLNATVKRLLKLNQCFDFFSLNLENWEASTAKMKSWIPVKLWYFHCLSHALFHEPVQLDTSCFQMNWSINYLKLCNTLFLIWCTRCYTQLFCYMNFRRVSATPYSNYSLLCTLLLKVFSSTIWNLLEYKLLFPVVSFCCMLSICYYISYGFYGVHFTKLSIVENCYVYCKKVLLTVSATT